MDTASKRRVFAILKISIYIGALIVLTLGIYAGINCIAYDNSVQNEEESESVDETERELDGKLKADTSNRIAVIVGTATVLMAVLTMLQQHINRRQDRALAFPKMVLTECQFVIEKDNVSNHTLFYNEKGGELLIKLLFQDTISHCYVPDIYRVEVAMHRYQEKVGEYTPVDVLNSFSGFGENGFYMEAVVQMSDLVKKFCTKQQGTFTGKLEIIMDVAWKNEFFMRGFQDMWNMYLRYKIRLNDTGRSTTDKEKGIYGYKVENVSLEEAPW
ncbi:MAG: hypothetical protein K2K46_13715 [Lachnospiraceae bacterium]|nr:hypothetical protein [Lachnospiraceae bacterium]